MCTLYKLNTWTTRSICQKVIYYSRATTMRHGKNIYRIIMFEFSPINLIISGLRQPVQSVQNAIRMELNRIDYVVFLKGPSVQLSQKSDYC